MSAESVAVLDRHISTDAILAGIKSPAMVVSLSGHIARVNQLCYQYLPRVKVGRALVDICEEQGVFGSLRQMIRHARTISGLHPCRLTTKGAAPKPALLGYFSILRSQLTHKPIAILLQVDDRSAERLDRLHSLNLDMDKRAVALRQFHRDGIHDPLTGLKNRRYMDSFLKMECDLIKRQSVGGSLVVVDIDYFKRVNDVYGHNAGDMVIKEVADALTRRLRDSDIACRWGGEEFVLFLHNTSGARAFSICEELRTLVQHHRFSYQERAVPITASFGLTTLTPGDEPQTVFARADDALYQAKKMGRNQVQVSV